MNFRPGDLALIKSQWRSYTIFIAVKQTVQSLIGENTYSSDVPDAATIQRALAGKPRNRVLLVDVIPYSPQAVRILAQFEAQRRSIEEQKAAVYREQAAWWKQQQEEA